MRVEKKIDPNSLCYHIIQKVKNVRLYLGLTQAEFSEKTDVAKSLIAKYERCVHNITPDKLEKIAGKLPRNIEYFFPKPVTFINSENKQAFDLVQNLKRIKDSKAYDAMCTFTRCLADGIQIRKATIGIKPAKDQMVQKAKDWRLTKGYTRTELADKTGLPYWQIVSYEQGDVSFKVAPKIEEGLSLHSGALLPTSQAESYCEVENSQEENKISNIMKEYHRIDNQKLKDAISKFFIEVVKIIEEDSKI